MILQENLQNVYFFLISQPHGFSREMYLHSLTYANHSSKELYLFNDKSNATQKANGNHEHVLWYILLN